MQVRKISYNLAASLLQGEMTIMKNSLEGQLEHVHCTLYKK